MRPELLCIYVLRVASGPRMKLASCKSALNAPEVYFTDRSKAVVSVLVLLFVALWFIPRGDLFYVLPCVILFLCFSVLLALRLPRLGKLLFVRLFDLCLFGFVGFLFLLVFWEGLRFVIVALSGLFFYLIFLLQVNTVITELVSILALLLPVNTLIAELVSVHVVLFPMNSFIAELISIQAL